MLALRYTRPRTTDRAGIAYTFGWRTQSEVLTLIRAQVDLDAGTLRLHAGTTTIDDGREAYMTPELRRLVGAQIGRVRALERGLGRIIPTCSRI